MKKNFIISAVLTLIDLILGCYMLFAQLPEYEYFLIIEVISILLFAVAVTTLVVGLLLPKTNNSCRLKKAYITIVSVLVVSAVLYTPCAFISCYEEYTPEVHYIENGDYIQQFLPLIDINEVKTRDDLFNSIIMYTDYPGFSHLTVCNRTGLKNYEMKFTKSLNPIYNLRNAFDVMNTCYTSEKNNYIIRGTKVCVYSDIDNLYGYINRYGKCITISASNCKADFISENAFAEYVCEQFELADTCVTSKCFRDAPWYDIGYYIKALSEPYESSEYFL